MIPSKKLFESKFSKKLMSNVRLIINKWSNIIANDIKNPNRDKKKRLTFENVGNNEEQNYYKIAEKFWAIQNTLEDIDKVFYFIEVDKSKIIDFCPKIETQQNYFKYHIENYIIRIYTLIDLVGKLGNQIYQTNIPDEKCDCYKFKEKIKKSNPEIAKSLEDIISFVNSNRIRRNTKLHTGKLEIDELKNISFWEDYTDILPDSFYNNDFLKSIEKDKFQLMIDELKIFLSQLITKINIFLDQSISKI